MKSICCVIALIVTLAGQPFAHAEDPLFSGPQIGEMLPSFTMNSVLGETAGQEVDFIKQAGGQPVLLVFFHARTRPAFGLSNMLMRYAETRAKDGLHSGVVFLTDDPTKTEQWMRVVENHLAPEAVVYGISSEGQEGPGSYGLNRNVTLTVLVGKNGNVTANFALVQPSIQADGPKILKAIADATGGGKVPTIAELGGRRYQNADRDRMKKMRRGQENDPRLTKLLRAVIQKDATAEDVEKTIAEVEKYVADNEAARRQLGRLASRVVGSGRLSTYGTKHAHDALTKWAKSYATPPKTR